MSHFLWCPAKRCPTSCQPRPISPKMRIEGAKGKVTFRLAAVWRWLLGMRVDLERVSRVRSQRIGASFHWRTLHSRGPGFLARSPVPRAPGRAEKERAADPGAGKTPPGAALHPITASLHNPPRPPFTYPNPAVIYALITHDGFIPHPCTRTPFLSPVAPRDQLFFSASRPPRACVRAYARAWKWNMVVWRHLNFKVWYLKRGPL